MAASTGSPVTSMSSRLMLRSSTMSAPTFPFDICMQAITIGMMLFFSVACSRSLVRFDVKKRRKVRMRW